MLGIRVLGLMIRMRTATILTTFLLALALGAPQAAAAPKLSEDDDKFVLENDHVRVWFQGKKPMLKLLPAASDEASYQYDFTSVVEYRDVDGDGAVSKSEVVSSLDLHGASDWVVERSETEDAVVLNLTLTAPVKLGRGDLPAGGEVPLPDRDASISLVFTIHGAATMLDAGGLNVSIPATSIKYDFLVHAWPFANAELDRLALETRVHGDVELENATGLDGAEVLTNGTAVGALSWTTLAQGDTTDGARIDVPVRTAVQSDGDGATLITYTYDAADLVTLVHDPTVGVTPTAESIAEGGAPADNNPVPGAGVLVAVAVVGATALALRRR